MVYLLHSYFGRDGREESQELLERRSGSSDKPRILEAFNEPIEDRLPFYIFTTFTDRMASASCWRWRKAASIGSRARPASC